MFGRKKLKVRHTQEKQFKLVLAFEQGGKKYYQFENAFEMSTGRGLQALTIYEEFRMRCDREYLEKHIKAIEILINDPKGIKIGKIAENTCKSARARESYTLP